KCELLHCTSNTAPFFCPIPLVVTLHDIIYLENKGLLGTGGSLYQKFGNLYRRWNVPGAVKNAEAIITVSNFEKSNIDQKMPQIKDKTIAIYNGVGEHFSPIRESKTLSQVREKYKLPEKYIFFLGNLAPKKNTPNVLKAYNRYHNSVSNPLPLVMIDFGKEKLRQMLASFQMENLLEHIHLSGYISNTDLPAIYSMSELFLYPSLRESFGIPILEAMRCGTPVITSTTSSMPEIAGDAALLVNPNNSKELANAIEYILSDLEFREKLIQKGFNRSKKFSWTKMAERNLKLYNKIYNELQKNKQ
ncbi:MAG: glycosyltransferase family 4 protein, partial [Marinifilaceae bacterium]